MFPFPPQLQRPQPVFTASGSNAVLASEHAAHTQQRRGHTLHLLPPAAPADPTASNGSPNTAASTDQQSSFLLLPTTRSGGEDEKPIEEQICSEADLKEKRERQIRKQGRKIKINCHLLRFLGFAGDEVLTGGRKVKRGGSHYSPPTPSCCLDFTAAREPTRRQWRRRVEEKRRHCSCSCRRPSLQFLKFLVAILEI